MGRMHKAICLLRGSRLPPPPPTRAIVVAINLSLRPKIAKKAHYVREMRNAAKNGVLVGDALPVCVAHKLAINLHKIFHYKLTCIDPSRDWGAAGMTRTSLITPCALKGPQRRNCDDAPN
jgi:hypothetical protein